MDFRADIAKHADDCRDQEVCGFVVYDPFKQDNTIIRAENRAKDPTMNFLIDPEIYLRIMADRNMPLRAFYHSHTHESCEATPMDRNTADETLTPMYVYSQPAKELSCYVPEKVREANLIGRQYLPLVFDCVSLVQDYYFNRLHIYSPYLSRTYKDGIVGYRALFAYMKEIGMQQVNGEPQLHDVIIMALRAQRPNHAAVYLGNKRILHQCDGKPSCEEVYGGFWEKNVTSMFRHPHYL